MKRTKFPKKAMFDAIRKYCLECCGGSPKEVTLCSGGHHADGTPLEKPRCELFPYRLGRQKTTETTNFKLVKVVRPPKII